MSYSDLPLTRYATSGEVNVAYQVLGDGPIDIIMVPGIVSHVEFLHEMPGYTAFLQRLSKFARVTTFDKRGQGLSDRISGAPTLEQRMDDVRAVMDDIGSRRAALLGFSEGCAMSAMFAASYPERVSHLILFGGFIRYADLFGVADPERIILERMKSWGAGAMIRGVIASKAANPDAVAQFAKFERLSASPGAMKAIQLLNLQIDVGHILRAVRIPTLVLHRATDALVPVQKGRDFAAQVPGAKYIEYPDGDHAFWSGDVEALLGEIEEFITGHRETESIDLERILATVMFTDIVDSTRRAAEMGDQNWRRLLDSHDQLARQIVERHRGNLIKNTGDGILATFDGPGRAVRCALAFSAAAKQIGLPLRSGLHTGEIEVRGRDIGGIAVHATARVMAKSGAEEVLVSRVVTDLVAGAGLKFDERGVHEFKGLPGRWDLFAASA
jgi:pimeloyl-ACP methyl ester carboxylesterase